MGLFKLLSDNGDKSLTAADLAVMSGYDQTFIGECGKLCILLLTHCYFIIIMINCPFQARVMRLISAIGWAEETGYQTYTANAFTVCQNRSGEQGSFIIS
jgi:hypothetical protein